MHELRFCLKRLTNFKRDRSISQNAACSVICPSTVLCLNDSGKLFGKCFGPSECKILLQDWIGPSPDFVGKDSAEVDECFCLGSYISLAGRISNAAQPNTQNGGLAITNLKRLPRRPDLGLPIKTRVFDFNR